MLLDHVPFLFSDSGAYIGQAFSLKPSYDRPLGYAVFLRWVFTFSHDLNSAMYVQSVIGVFTIIGFLCLAQKYILRSFYGWILFFTLAAIDLRLILFEHYILSESLSTFLLLPYFYFLFKSLETHDKRYILCLGFSMAILILTRNIFMFCIPFTMGAFIVQIKFEKNVSRKTIVRLTYNLCILCLGLITILGSYSLYNHGRTGNFGITFFDGYSLWTASGHPGICSSDLQNEAKQIICNNKYAHVHTVGEFRNIWLPGSPTSDLQKRFEDRKTVNAILRTYAVESIWLHPVEYVFSSLRKVPRLFMEHVSYVDHMGWVRETNAATQVRRHFGSQHPSLQDVEFPIWPKLKSLMEISKLYGLLFGLFSCLYIFRPAKDTNILILMCWLGAYIVTSATFGGGGWSRLYVVMTLPLLLVISRFVEDLVTFKLNQRLK